MYLLHFAYRSLRPLYLNRPSFWARAEKVSFFFQSFHIPSVLFRSSRWKQLFWKRVLSCIAGHMSRHHPEEEFVCDSYNKSNDFAVAVLPKTTSYQCSGVFKRASRASSRLYCFVQQESNLCPRLFNPTVKYEWSYWHTTLCKLDLCLPPDRVNSMFGFRSRGSTQLWKSVYIT